MTSSLLRRLGALGLLAASMPAAATTQVTIEGARSYMDSHGTNAAFVEAVFPEHALGQRFSWAPDVTAGWIDGRDIAKYRDNKYGTRSSVALLAAGARFSYGDEHDWYRPYFFSFQVAGTNHTTMALSSHYQFVSTLGWQASHFMAAIRHISNGSLSGPNRGETMGLVGVTFAF